MEIDTIGIGLLIILWAFLVTIYPDFFHISGIMGIALVMIVKGFFTGDAPGGNSE